MKRCPKCEFIYEDDQSLCDMDGALLVFDARTLPTTKAAQKRNRAVPTFATLILALVLGLVYYVSIHRRAAQTSYTPPSAAAPSNPAPEVKPTPESQPPAAAEPKPEPPKTVTAPAPVKKAVAKPTPPSTKTKVDDKKDSKVNSILKKTGRILKKPFKF
jgi:cytoskeletal protein RodZ